MSPSPQPEGNFITYFEVKDLSPFETSGDVSYSYKFDNALKVAVSAKFESNFMLGISVRVRVYAYDYVENGKF